VRTELGCALTKPSHCLDKMQDRRD